MSYFGPRSMQYLATFSTSILTCTVGMFMSWSSPALPLLQSENSPIGVTLTVDEGSWVTSIFLLGYLIGMLLIGLLLDRCGRRMMLLMSAVPIFVSWIMIFFARSFIVLALARLLGGIGLLVPTAISVVYVSEISEPAIRGKLSMINYFMLDVGGALISAIGCYMPYFTVIAISAAFPVAFFLTFYWMPESPAHSLRKGNIEMARSALSRFRDDAVIEKELSEMKMELEAEMNNQGTIKELFITRKFRKSLLLLLGMAALQQLSGTMAITNYMKTIFLEASSGFDSNLSSILCMVVTVPMTLIGSYFIDKCGRKPLYFLSITMCTIGLCCNYIYFLFQNNLGMDVTKLGWLPVLGLFVYSTFISVGIGYMPFIYLGEIVAFRMKSHTLAALAICNSLFAFIVSFLFPIIAEEWTVSVCFLIFIISCVVGFVFVLICVPETKGKSLEEVQEML